MNRLESIHQIFDELVRQERADETSGSDGGQNTVDLLDIAEVQTWPEVVAELLYVPAGAKAHLPASLADLAMRLGPLQPAVLVDLAAERPAKVMQVVEPVTDNFEDEDDE